MINQYGADAVRLFIMSDSPPEKDIQWSDAGVASANKFLQKIWNLNYLILKRKEITGDNTKEKKFYLEVDNFVNKIDASIKNFRFNVCIAHFHQVYNLFKENIESTIKNDILKENIIKIMKLMMPFAPHLSYECLDLHNCKTINTWPEIKKDVIEEINLAVQVNGKTRDIIKILRDLTETDVKSIVQKKSKATKYIENKKINKIIFVKNRIINYII